MTKNDEVRSFARRRACRAPAGKVLIVTEGEKMEVFYFRACVQELQLGRGVKVTHNPDGPTPDKVLAYARELADEELRRGSPYDAVYCVMDRDKHSTFDKTLAAVVRLKKRNFLAICSYPSFEYWYLLHHEYTRASFEAEGSRSAGDCVERALKRHWPGYKKSDPTVWRALRDRLPETMKRARRARADAVATGELNPSTEADLLVEALQKLVA